MSSHLRGEGPSDFVADPVGFGVILSSYAQYLVNQWFWIFTKFSWIYNFDLIFKVTALEKLKNWGRGHLFFS